MIAAYAPHKNYWAHDCETATTAADYGPGDSTSVYVVVVTNDQHRESDQAREDLERAINEAIAAVREEHRIEQA